MKERYNHSWSGSETTKQAAGRVFPQGVDTPIRKFLQLPISTLLKNSNAGIFITDDEDTLIWANEVLHEHSFMGPELKAIINKPVTQITAYLQTFVVYSGLFSQRISELVKNKKPYFGEKIPLRNGSIIRLDYEPVFNEEVFCGAVWQFVDCTEREHVSQKINPNHSFGGTLDKFHISFCEINKEGDIIRPSPFFCKFTGYLGGELLKSNFLDLCLSGKEKVIDCLQNTDTGILTKKIYSFELEIILRDDTKWVQCHAFCNVEGAGSVSGCMLFMTEITEQKSIQRELEDARKVAENAQLAQQQFLASMSHDIRTPLNAIIGMTLLIADTSLDKKQRDYVKILRNASNILLDLLNGILDFAKIESGRQEIRQNEFNLPGLLRSLIETFSFKLTEKAVESYCEIDPKIEHLLVGDSTLLNQILMNLLSNAEKFTEKGKIGLKAKILRNYENNVWVEFRVEDTGIGIAKEKLEEIFQDFKQADEGIKLNYGGSGLGLFICKRLVEMMGGRVTVESIEGSGTVFTFALPFTMTNKPLMKEKNDILSSSFNKKGVCILIVEDNPMNLKYLSTILEREELDFDITTDGMAALEKTQEKFYNLILMDIKLPKMEGIEVTSHIRSGENPNAATPVVLVSAEAFQDTVDQAKNAGVNELLTKPYTPEQLIRVLEKYLVEEDQEDKNEQDDDAYKFNEKLDIAYLEKLYSGNCNYAMSLFDVFLECTEEDWVQIQRAMKEKDWVELKNMVHKVKPNFSMVGLTWITEMVQEVYDKLRENDQEDAVQLLHKVQGELDQNMPLIKKESERMRLYLLSRKFPE